VSTILKSGDITRAVHAALARAMRTELTAVTAAQSLLIDVLSTRFERERRSPRDIVAPLPVVAAAVHDVFVLNVPTTSPRARLGVNLLSTAMHRSTALVVGARHAALLAELSELDARIVLALARRWPAPLLTRLELRCETLRGSARVTRRLRVVDDANDGSDRLDEFAVSLQRDHTASLERLGLVTWSERTITPTEDPRFARARQQARMGTVSFADSLRRWLAGTHLAPVEDDEVIIPPVPNRGVIGGIEVSYRAIHVTDEGRSLLRAVRPARRLVDRRWQAIDQRALQQVHTLT
jgi:hypothetical protein